MDYVIVLACGKIIVICKDFDNAALTTARKKKIYSYKKVRVLNNQQMIDNP